MKTVLLDPADAVMLLLDHQNGPSRTVKDVPLAELRTNTLVLAKVAKLEVPPYHHGVIARRPERAACARTPGSGAQRDVRAPQGRDQRLGQRGLCSDGQEHLPQDADRPVQPSLSGFLRSEFRNRMLGFISGNVQASHKLPTEQRSPGESKKS